MINITYDKGYLKIPIPSNNLTFSIQVDNSTNIKAFASLFVEYGILYKLTKPNYKKYLFGLVKCRKILSPDTFIFKSHSCCMVIVLSYSDKNTIQITKDDKVYEYTLSNKEIRDNILNVYQQCLGYAESIK